MLISKCLSRFFFLSILVSLVGCASVQQPVSFNLKPESNLSIGVVQVASPEPGAQYTGNIGLLDLAIIAAANGGLNKHLKTQEFASDYQSLPKEVGKILESQGYKVVMIDKDIDAKAGAKFKNPQKGVNKTDFSKYKTEYGISHLLVLKMPMVGTTRSYYGPVPLTEPTAQAIINAMVVDLQSNKLEWYTTATSSKVIEKPWDEGDKKWPNLTNSVFTAVDEATKLIKTELENPDLVNRQVSAK